MDDRAELIKRLREDEAHLEATTLGSPRVRRTMREAADALEVSHPVKADRVEIAKIIDPHSFCDIPFTDEQVLLDMVEQSKEDALRKADRILSALEAAPAVPDGWKLVPIEPTTGMFRALTSWVKGNEALDVIMGKWLLGRFREDYLAMLAAAPEAPGHVPTPSPAAEPVALASARQEGFEAGLKAAVDRYADAETWDYFLAAEEAILALSTKEGAEG